MTIYDYEQKLHDRFTRGEQLTDEELAHLEAWYRAQDHAESALLAKSYPPTNIVMLRAQLETALQQLTLVSQHITNVLTANNALRQDIARLQAQLVADIHEPAA
jgi:hypothetical protein